MDLKMAKKINEASQKALETVATEFGLTLSPKSGSYDPSTGTYTFKIEFAEDGADKREFERSVRLLTGARQDGTYGQLLAPEALGAKFCHQGRDFVLTGINLRAPKFPLQAKCLSDGKSYKFPQNIVRLLPQAS